MPGILKDGLNVQEPMSAGAAVICVFTIRHAVRSTVIDFSRKWSLFFPIVHGSLAPVAAKQASQGEIMMHHQSAEPIQCIVCVCTCWVGPNL